MVKQAFTIVAEHSAKLTVRNWAEEYLKQGNPYAAIALVTATTTIEGDSKLGICLPSKGEARALIADPIAFSRLVGAAGLSQVMLTWQGAQGNHFSIPADLEPEFSAADDPLIDVRSRDSLLKLIEAMHESSFPESLGDMEDDSALYANPFLLEMLGETLSEYRSFNFKSFWITRSGEPDPTLQSIKNGLRQSTSLRITYENLFTQTERARLDSAFTLRFGTVRHCRILQCDLLGVKVTN